LENQLIAARAQATQAMPEAEVAALKQELADTQGKLSTALHDYAEMQKERDALAQHPAPTAVTDLSGRVGELEAQLATKSAAPTYPDLREQVSNLEIQLEAARQLPKHAIPEAEVANLKQELADTKIKLETTLHGYSLIEKERDELAVKTDRTPANQPEVARLTEAYTALQRSAAQNERDLAATRALLQQVQGANVLLAQQNSQLKGTLATGAPRIAPTPTAQPTPVVAASPIPPATGRMHTVVAGDTLAKISQRYYGTVSNWQPIYNANRELLGPNGSLKVGTELRIP
jgi:chromosome segregation ATPase